MAVEYDSIGTKNAPMISFPMIAGMTIAGGTPATVEIPLVLTAYTSVTRVPTTGLIGTIPIIDDNFAYGGQTVSVGNIQLPKVSMEGHIDTPVTDSGGWQLPNIVLSGRNLTYADLIAMYLEGRASAVGWRRIDPLWFRDPYGRTYNSPFIMDFTATYVEAVPGRNNFTLQLKV